MTFQALRLLNALRRSADGCVETDSNGVRWAQVCILNVQVPGIEPKQKSGYLSQIAKAGFYRAHNKYFGMVQLSNTEE